MSQLWPLAAFAGIEVGARVVMAGGDGVVVVVESGGREASIDGGCHCVKASEWGLKE